MQVNRDSWHARVYRWWYTAKYGPPETEFLAGLGYYPKFTNTNLCPYVRAVMLWSWMRFLFISGRVGKLKLPYVSVPLLLIEIPRWAGIFSYRAKHNILLFYATAVGLSIYFYCGHRLDRYLQKRKANRVSQAPRSGFFTVLKAYSRAQHDRVCPEISFVGEEE